MKQWIKAIPYLLIIGLFLALSISVNTCSRIERESASKGDIVRTDTVTITKIDTLRIIEPRYISKKVVDTLCIKVTDTVNNVVYLPIEQKYYKGDNYSAWVSGYKPRLDSIHTYNKVETKYITTTITKAAKKKPFGIGVQVGYGLNSNFELTPYVGIGLSYNLITF